MLPLYKPVTERAATVKALVRALDRCVLYAASQERDTDVVQTEPLVYFTAHVFALPVRRLALAVSLIRAELRKPEAERTPDYVTTKATKLLAASAYFPNV